MWANKCVYLATLLYSGVLALLYTSVQCLYVFLLLLLFGISQAVIVQFSRRHVHVWLRANSISVNKDEPMQASLLIENTSILPVSCVKIIVSYENTLEKLKQYQSFLVSINSKTTQTINFTLTSEHVGNVQIGIKKVVVYDLLRIFHRNNKEQSKCEIKVFPEVFSIENQMLIRHQELLESEVFSKSKSGDDPSEVFDIREYKDGDKIHRIHWKLSSKRDCMMVKEYSLPIACSAGILVNLSLDAKEENRLACYDAMMATLASMSYHMIENEQVHYIAWYEPKKEAYHCEMVSNEEELYSVLHELLEVDEITPHNEIASVHPMLFEGQASSKIYYLTGTDLTKEYGVFATEYVGTEVEAIYVCDNELANKNQQDRALAGGVEYIELNGYKECIEALVL